MYVQSNCGWTATTEAVLGRCLKGRPRVVPRFMFQEPIAVVDGYSYPDWAGAGAQPVSRAGVAIMIGGHVLKSWSATWEYYVVISRGGCCGSGQCCGRTLVEPSWRRVGGIMVCCCLCLVFVFVFFVVFLFFVFVFSFCVVVLCVVVFFLFYDIQQLRGLCALKPHRSREPQSRACRPTSDRRRRQGNIGRHRSRPVNSARSKLYSNRSSPSNGERCRS